MVISEARASSGSAERFAHPCSSSRRTWVVMVGWLVWSASGEVADAGGAELVDLGEQADLRRRHLEPGLPGGPAVQARHEPEQLVSERGGGGHDPTIHREPM